MCAALLERQGYEPHRTEACLQLRNCPFHPHAETERDLVCGLDHALLSGVLDGLRGRPGGHRRPRPGPRPVLCRAEDLTAGPGNYPAAGCRTNAASPSQGASGGVSSAWAAQAT